MNKPVPAPVIPAGSGREPAPARHDQGHARSGSLSLTVRYYRAMKPRRVYPLVVELPRATAKPVGGSTAPLTVKPIIGGAVVAPAEQALELNPAGGEIRFQVTPVAKGRLKDARVEVSQQGRPVESIPLKMKAKTQRLTWILLLLTLIIPSVVVYYTSIAPLTGEVPGVGRGPAFKKQIPAGAGGGDAPAPAAPRNPAAPNLPVPPPAPDPDAGQIVRMRTGTPGEVLQYKISDLIHKNIPKPDNFDLYFFSVDLSYLNKEKENYVVSEQPHDVVEWVAWSFNVTYQYLYLNAKELYPAFFLALGLGALTLLSLVAHRTLRGKARRIGIRLSDSAPMGHARSASSREELPAALEAAN